jgi:hypothetical protein
MAAVLEQLAVDRVVGIGMFVAAAVGLPVVVARLAAAAAPM